MNIRNLEENVRKDLRICLLSSEERSSHFTDALPVNNVKDSKEVKLKISQELLERLLASQPDFRHKCYEYRYNTFGDKILFYINESFERETAQDSIDFYKKVYDRIYSTKENT